MNILHILHVSPQDLSHAPGLCDASARPLRYVTVEDFRDVSKSAIRKMTFQRFEPFGRLTSCNLASPLTFMYAVMKGPINHGHTVPWW